MAIEFLRQLRAAVFGPVGTAFSFDRAPHESRILGRELTKLTLHGVDDGALFGDLFRDGGDPTSPHFSHGQLLCDEGWEDFAKTTRSGGAEGAAGDLVLSVCVGVC
jgi:hypothetical protein